MGFNELMRDADNILLSAFNVDGGVLLWPGDVNERQIVGVFDTPYSRTDIPDGGYIAGSDTSFTAHDRDISNLAKKDSVLINNEVWYVKEMQPDGSGITRVFLSKYQKSQYDKPGGLL